MRSPSDVDLRRNANWVELVDGSGVEHQRITVTFTTGDRELHLRFDLGALEP